MTFDVTEIIVALIGLLAAVTTAFVVPWIKAKLGETRLETLYKAAEVAVYAAEQLGLTKVVKDKLAYAMEQVTAAMAKQGVTYDEATVRAAVEAAVRRMNGAG